MVVGGADNNARGTCGRTRPTVVQMRVRALCLRDDSPDDTGERVASVSLQRRPRWHDGCHVEQDPVRRRLLRDREVHAHSEHGICFTRMFERRLECSSDERSGMLTCRRRRKVTKTRIHDVLYVSDVPMFLSHVPLGCAASLLPALTDLVEILGSQAVSFPGAEQKPQHRSTRVNALLDKTLSSSVRRLTQD